MFSMYKYLVQVVTVHIKSNFYPFVMPLMTQKHLQCTVYLRILKMMKCCVDTFKSFKLLLSNCIQIATESFVWTQFET